MQPLMDAIEQDMPPELLHSLKEGNLKPFINLIQV
jgi:hypothetical protein